MLLRRTMLCGICIHDTRSRQRIHLLVCHDGRTHRLDYRVGPGIGIHRSRNHGKHQLEPLSGRLSRGTGHTSTASPHRLSLGWWSRKYPRLPYRRADEPLPDTGYGRQLHLQRLHCIPEGFRHTDFVILGWKYINTDNYTPYIPANTGVLGEYGFSGILRGAAIVFFAFLGFDAVSTAAQETKNPKRNMPIGILVSPAGMHRALYGFAHVMTGVAHYTAFSGQQGIAPVAIAIEHMGQADAAGIIQPDYPWLNRAIVLVHSVRILLRHHGDTAGTEPRIPKHEPRRAAASFLLAYQRKVPYSGTQQPALHGTCGPAGSFVPARLAGEMTSIGTLMAFTLVCAAVLVVRRTMPDVPRSFKTPLVPLIPILGILTCLCMMLFLPADTWIRLVLWMLIGLDIYVGYGMKHSKLEHGGDTRHGQVALNMIGLILAVLCVITGLWHQQTVGWGESKVLLIISFVFAFTHCAYYMWRIWRK